MQPSAARPTAGPAPRHGSAGATAGRLPDWPARLDAFIEQRRRSAFAWGVHDCCQFARAAVA
ncbi:MAG: hypothetical protein FJ399_18170, partial [Verrucomicrobia bacterium]|nr:hypothetical protein [Verrucomicrobiota bacterium]